MLKKYKTILSFIAITLSSVTAMGSQHQFTASKQCEMYNSLKHHTNTGGLHTVAGQSYKIKQENDDYIYVGLPQEYTVPRWIKKSCGVIEGDTKVGIKQKKHVTSAKDKDHFIPFFANAKDHITKDQPIIPTLTEFDHAVLKACGGWGDLVTRSNLNTLFAGKALQSIYKELNHTIITKDADIDTFAKELISIWLDHRGFEHVMCGQPHSHTLGGLHYVGRYLQMQQNKWGGLNATCNKEEIKGPIYTIGVDFITSKGTIATKCPSGYDYNMNVYHTIVEGTKTFKEVYNKKGKDWKGACISSNKQGDFVFVKGNDAIVTFYPDASPSASLKSCNNLS